MPPIPTSSSIPNSSSSNPPPKKFSNAVYHSPALGFPQPPLPPKNSTSPTTSSPPASLFSTKKGKEKETPRAISPKKQHKTIQEIFQQSTPKKDITDQFTNTSQTITSKYSPQTISGIDAEETCDVDMLDFSVSGSPVPKSIVKPDDRREGSKTLLCDERLSSSSATSNSQRLKFADLDEFLADSESTIVDESTKKEMDENSNVDMDDLLVPDSQPATTNPKRKRETVPDCIHIGNSSVSFHLPLHLFSRFAIPCESLANSSLPI
jgi:hypothetical protein